MAQILRQRLQAKVEYKGKYGNLYMMTNFKLFQVVYETKLEGPTMLASDISSLRPSLKTFIKNLKVMRGNENVQSVNG